LISTEKLGKLQLENKFIKETTTEIKARAHHVRRKTKQN